MAGYGPHIEGDEQEPPDHRPQVFCLARGIEEDQQIHTVVQLEDGAEETVRETDHVYTSEQQHRAVIMQYALSEEHARAQPCHVVQ